jgi:hypothetical protein
MNRPPFQVIAKPQTRGKSTSGERGNHNGHIDRGQHDSYAGNGTYGEHNVHSEHKSYDDHRGQGVYKIHKEHKNYKDHTMYPRSSKRDWLDETEDLKAGKSGIVETLKDEDWAEWSPGRQEWMVMATLALISLIVALDATILVSALPVSPHANL